jgi:hypothetical protein
VLLCVSAGPRKIKRLARLIAIFIAKGAHAVDTVSEEAFQNIFTEIFGDDYKLPSAATVFLQ